MTRDEIISLLQGLGTNANEIAESLMALGIKGLRVSLTEDPISNFLKSNNVIAYSSGPTGISIANINRINYNLPDKLEALRHFCLCFETGKYPDLGY